MANGENRKVAVKKQNKQKQKGTGKKKELNKKY